MRATDFTAIDEVEELSSVSKSKTKGFKGPRDVEGIKALGVTPITDLGQFSVWHGSMQGESIYYIIDNSSQQAQIQLGCRERNNVLTHLNLYAAPGNTVKAVDFYRILITKLGKTLVADRQSPGSQAVWARLAKLPDVGVHGWLNGQAVNITPADREYAYGTPDGGRWSRANKTGVQSWISNKTPENTAARNMKLVAHKK